MYKNIIVSVVVMMLSLGAYAEDDQIFDVIAGGAEEFEFVRFSAEEIQLKIKEDMMVACKNGLCTLFADTQVSGEFTTTFNIGYGVLGTTADGEGVSGSPDGEFIGLSIGYTYKKCTQEIKVPKSIYGSVNTYMYSLITENGEPRRTLTPASEAMLMFTTTILKQLTGCK